MHEQSFAPLSCFAQACSFWLPGGFVGPLCMQPQSAAWSQARWSAKGRMPMHRTACQAVRIWCISSGLHWQALPHRYWVAAVQNFDNTWVSNFTVFVDYYGTDGELTGAAVQALIPKPRMWLASVYWALTTVQPSACVMHGSCRSVHLPAILTWQA